MDKWRRPWHVRFDGEAGIDAGGLRRELLTVLAATLVKTLFVPLTKPVQDESEEEAEEDSSSGEVDVFADGSVVVHPRPLTDIERPFRSLDWFKLFGRVCGKLIWTHTFDNLGAFLASHLSRAFVRYVLGFRVNYRCFETDDPALWNSKVRYVVYIYNINKKLIINRESRAVHNNNNNNNNNNNTNNNNNNNSKNDDDLIPSPRSRAGDVCVGIEAHDAVGHMSSKCGENGSHSEFALTRQNLLLKLKDE